ncbi:MAG TPA: helix-turn-helix transcriptional regulator [Gaiellales bacterium]|nr:helix-turn-helix transcriptional regulator [Gaiellales bacterium]
MARLARRRNAGYQRLDPAELRRSLATFTAAFFAAADGGSADPLEDYLSEVVTRRLRQGVHPLEVFGVWQELRWVLELNFSDQPATAELLDRAERIVIDGLREGVSLSTPHHWPSHEVGALRRSIERLNVSLELVEQRAAPGGSDVRARVALTQREREVLTHASAGLTTERIATAMGVSPATVRTYLSRSIEKLGAANRVHAVALAVSSGIVVPPAERS